jgi:ergothioneine biosynthesis protein EgtB
LTLKDLQERTAGARAVAPTGAARPAYAHTIARLANELPRVGTSPRTKGLTPHKKLVTDPYLLAPIYQGLRNQTRALTVPLSVEDQSVQSMPDASPTKWHLAHTTWFFETFVLMPHKPGYHPFDPFYAQLFNSYYQQLGKPYPRAQRGLLTRPSCEDIVRYRAYVDEHMAMFMEGNHSLIAWDDAEPLIQLGCHHEQQHQELLLMDILHAFSRQPGLPAYRPQSAAAISDIRVTIPLHWIHFPSGDYETGHHGAGFAFDNESPRHAVKLGPFAIASRAVNNGEWLAFMQDGGYTRPELWLSDGWDTMHKKGWNSPLYWFQNDAGAWQRFTLSGPVAMDPTAPVCHISYYEADAFARWSGKRLPTEAEWEVAGISQAPENISRANFLESGVFEPRPPSFSDDRGTLQMFGDVWEWTQSPYAPYPGFSTRTDAVGEYNGKFMVNQMVLRGGSCLTPASHIRATYRNFFYPHMRWQFAGLRLADNS